MFESLVNFISEQFAALHGHVFETGVLPLVYALGLGGYAEQAFSGVEIFLIGVIEITMLAVVLGALEKHYPMRLMVRCVCTTSSPGNWKMRFRS